MKKNHLFYVLAFLIIATIGIVSCNDNEPKFEVENFTSNIKLIDSLKKVYDSDILPSNLYKVQKYNMLEMIDKLDSALKYAPMDDRTKFSDYISNNLSLTKFNSTNDALHLYDDIVESSDDYHIAYKSFFTELSKLDMKDIRIVISNGLGSSPSIVTNGHPCQEHCMDAVSLAIDLLDEYMCNYYEDPQATSFGMMFAEWLYWRDYQSAIYDFNDCLNAC
ncbi:hypothetical protein [Flavobacterium sp. 3HN19-14]|uniref:hypothetical protein n=1 Tax=Flavobacterium sp. 3HN19-14 TaxID=3448133 RepID=UPI003EE2727C